MLVCFLLFWETYLKAVNTVMSFGTGGIEDRMSEIETLIRNFSEGAMNLFSQLKVLKSALDNSTIHQLAF